MLGSSWRGVIVPSLANQLEREEERENDEKQAGPRVGFHQGHNAEHREASLSTLLKRGGSGTRAAGATHEGKSWRRVEITGSLCRAFAAPPPGAAPFSSSGAGQSCAPGRAPHGAPAPPALPQAPPRPRRPS